MRTVDGCITRLTADALTWDDLEPGTTRLVAVDGIRFGTPYEGYADHLTTVVLQPTGLMVEGMRRIPMGGGGSTFLALTVWMGPVMVEMTFDDATVLTLEQTEPDPAMYDPTPWAQRPATGPDSAPTGYSGHPDGVLPPARPTLHTLLQQRDPRDG